MKTLTVLIAALCAFSVSGRLIDKNTEKTPETPHTEPTTPVRVSRQAFDEDVISISREEFAQPQEEFRPYIRRGRHSIKSKSNVAKVTRPSKDLQVADVTNKVEIESEEAKPTKTLVKKPIPKFNEVDYEDFQGKMSKYPAKFADSGEHEDEDFNLDDYEFDVNHDEFVGRGKPLEPRVKVKNSKGTSEKKTPKISASSLSLPEIKIQSKVVIPTEPLVRTKNGITKKVAEKVKEDYYDDVISTTTKAPEVESKRDSDEFADDTEESKEFNNKNPVRVIRSPGLVKRIANKMGDKTATVLSNIANGLPPIFLHERLSGNVDGPSDNANDVMTDPLTGNLFMS